MSLVVDIVFFLIFLAIYGLWLWASRIVSKKMEADLSFGRSGLNQVILAVGGFVPLVVFVGILTGRWNWSLLGILTATTILGIVITTILWALLGSTDNKWLHRAAWAGGEIGTKNAKVTYCLIAVMLIAIVLYPIMTGVSYFSAGDPSTKTLRIFQYTLFFLAFIGLFALIPMLMAQLCWENLDEDTRTRVFVAQLGGLIPNYLLLTLTMMALGPADANGGLDLTKTIAVPYSFPAMIALLLFFVCTVLLPYFVGANRSKRWRLALAQQRRQISSKIVDALSVPTAGTYASTLRAVSNELVDSYTSLRNSDVMIVWGELIETKQTPPGLEALANSFIETRNLDPRFVHIDWMRQTNQRIIEIITDIDSRATPEDKMKSAEAWSKNFQAQRSEIDEEKKKITETKLPLNMIVVSIVTTITTVILNGIGKAWWDVIAKAAGLAS